MAFVVHSRQVEKYTPHGNVPRYAHAGWYAARVCDRRGVDLAVPAAGAGGSLGQVIGDRTMMPPTATAAALTSPQSARPKGREPMVALAFALSGRRRLGRERGRWLDFSTARAPGEVATEPVSWPSATIIF
jgi:hypothetical protein